MEIEYRDSLYAAPHYPQTLKLCSQRQNLPVICEDQKATAQLQHCRAEGSDSTETESLSLYLHAPATVAENSVSEIELDSLRKADQILIETARSVYVFTIKDPKALSGKLIGGLLGNRLVDAYLMPDWARKRGSTAAPKNPKVGEKLTFFIDAPIGPQRLTTSAAKALIHRRKPEPPRSRARKRQVTLEQVSD